MSANFKVLKHDQRLNLFDEIQDFSSLFEVYIPSIKPDSKGEARIKCPLPGHPEEHPSFTVNVKTSLYNCFSCHRKGNAITFIQEMEGVSPADAVKLIKDHFGIIKKTPYLNNKNSPKIAVEPVFPFISEDKINEYHKCLYLENQQILTRLKEEWGLSDDLILDLHLGFDGSRITIPVKDQHGTFVNVRRYKFDCTDKDKVISYGKGYGDVRLYPIDNLKNGKELVFLTEGEKDCIVAMSRGLNAVTGTGGAGTFKDKWIPLFKDKCVIILYDTDKAGRDGAEKVITALNGTAKWIKNVDIKLEKDVADYFNKHRKSVEDLMDLCEKTEKAVLPAEEPEEADKKPTAASIAVDFLHKFHMIGGKNNLGFWCGTFCLWNGKCYRKLKDGEMKIRIFRYLQEDEDLQRYATNSFVRDIQSNLEALVFIPENTKPDSWLNGKAGTFVSMENGILHLNFDAEKVSDLELVPHDPEFFTFSSLPYNFDPSANCEAFIKFINCVLPSDQKTQDVLQQWFGYGLLPDSRYHKFAILHGPGANGKSVVAGTYSALLGTENCCSIPLESFSSNHALEELVGKKANITFEFTDTDRIAEGVLKAISAGDPIQINPKFKPPYTTALTAKLTFCVNVLPRFADKTDGIWRRIVLLPFEVIIQESEQDRNLLAKIKTELSGVFNWSFEGLLSLVGTGSFAEAVTSSDAKNTYRLENSSARMFLTEECELSASTETPSNIFYNAYRRYCIDFGFKPVSNVVLGKELKNVYPKIIRTLKRNGNNRWWSYEGIRVNERYTTVSIS